jgi:hypothetical protein
LPSGVKVRLLLYDLLGRNVQTLVDAQQEAGTTRVPFNASSLSSGMYFYRSVVSGVNPLESGDFITTRKMIVLKYKEIIVCPDTSVYALVTPHCTALLLTVEIVIIF